jgi:hypothetical protein
MISTFKHKKQILIFTLFILFPIISLQAQETNKEESKNETYSM